MDAGDIIALILAILGTQAVVCTFIAEKNGILEANDMKEFFEIIFLPTLLLKIKKRRK